MTRPLDEYAPKNYKGYPQGKEVPFIGAGNAAAFRRPLIIASHRMLVTGIRLMLDGALAQDAANFWTFEVVETSEPATLGTVDTDTVGGVAFAQDVPQALSLDAATLADRTLEPGQALVLVATPATPGAGADLSAVRGLLQIDFQFA